MSTTIIEKLLDVGAQVVGNVLRAVTGRAIGGFVPSPSGNLPRPDLDSGAGLVQDSAGNLVVRSQVLTDEASFRDDFPGASLFTALSGTVTFTNGDAVVTGVGTSFLSEVSYYDYVKRPAGGESDWQRVARVVSDTEILLEDLYAGASGTGGERSCWVPTTGAGGAVSVATSEALVASGTTAASVTRVQRSVDYMPLLIDVHLRVTQRIANQETVVGLMDDPVAPTKMAAIVFDGTNNTQFKLRTRSSAAAADLSEVTIQLAGSLTTAQQLHYRLAISASGVSVSLEDQVLAALDNHVPGPYDVLSLVAQITNTGVPASSTTLAINVMGVSNNDAVTVQNQFPADPLLVSIREDTVVVSGYLTTTATTADQVIVSYTVPAGATAFIAGYKVNVNNGGPDANPLKIGRNAMTEVVSPGVRNGLVFRAFRFLTDTSEEENFALLPRWIGYGGDVIKITVTPSGAASTTWRASLDLVLRT